MAKPIQITLPTLHAGQVKIYNERSQYDVISCGRRFGKTIDMITRAAMRALRGQNAGIFTPNYKQLAEPFDALQDILAPVIKSASRTDGHIKLKTGGKIDFWVLMDNYLAGRGREYHGAFIDEAAFTKNGQMLEIWHKSIKPTLLTTRGTATVYSTPNGVADDNFFYRCWHDESMGFKRHHAPTSVNPYVPLDELEKERVRNHPMVFQQEYLAEFVDWSGDSLFSLEDMLLDGVGADYPLHNDYVFATIDTAMSDKENADGTAVVYWAVSKHFGIPLTILDWDIVQINSDLLNTWLPNVFDRLEQLSRQTNSRGGSAGAWIEDKMSGITLLQHARRMGWPVQAIEGKLTSAGKDGRALLASGNVFRKEVKFSKYALDKTMTFKGSARNHLSTQLSAFRIGDKDAYRRSDDLLDAALYGIIIALGGQNGY